jgi:hypothetical protein
MIYSSVYSILFDLIPSTTKKHDWTNDPNMKKGRFSQEEDKVLGEPHAELGLSAFILRVFVLIIVSVVFFCC